MNISHWISQNIKETSLENFFHKLEIRLQNFFHPNMRGNGLGHSVSASLKKPHSVNILNKENWSNNVSNRKFELR